MTQPAQRYEYKKLSWYPHMSAPEAAIWDRFIDAFPEMYDWCEYDVKVGQAPPFVSEHADEAIREQAPLYQYKIDVVAGKGDQIDLIELGQRATARKIGQIKAYKILYQRDINPASDPKPVVVTDAEMPEMGYVAQSEGVQLVVV